MDTLLKQIEAAQNANLYYLTLFAALALRDICGALSAPDGRANPARYCDWYTRYVIPRYDTLSADEAYGFRCSALHQGSAEPDKAKDYERVIFIESSKLSINVKRMVSGGRTAIMIDLKRLIPAILLEFASIARRVKGPNHLMRISKDLFATIQMVSRPG